MLTVGGLAALASQGMAYTRRERVVNVGSMHATVDRENTMPRAPVVGSAAVAGGLVLWNGGRPQRNARAI